MQRRARLCRSKGVPGICAVPIAWGAQDRNLISAHPSKWSLNELNLILFAALLHNPDADLLRATRGYLRDRYGESLPPELARMLLDTENIAADAMNIRGIRATGDGLANFYYELLRYAWMFPGWQGRVKPTRANLKRIFTDKERNVRRAEKMLQRIEELKDKMTRKAYREFHDRFEDLVRIARQRELGQKVSMTLWGLKDGTIKPKLVELEKLHGYFQQLNKISPRRTRMERDLPRFV
jgi:alpha-glucuronidase